MYKILPEYNGEIWKNRLKFEDFSVYKKIKITIWFLLLNIYYMNINNLKWAIIIFYWIQFCNKIINR